jgi:hypothetical protein
MRRLVAALMAVNSPNWRWRCPFPRCGHSARTAREKWLLRLPEMAKKRARRFWPWLEKSYWLDVIGDLATVGFFAYAIVVLLNTFVT